MSRPHVICESCFDHQMQWWVGKFWLYCPHFRVMARRRKETDRWTVDRGVSSEKAKAHMLAALKGMATRCRSQGTDLDTSFALVQRLFVENQAKDQK